MPQGGEFSILVSDRSLKHNYALFYAFLYSASRLATSLLSSLAIINIISKRIFSRTFWGDKVLIIYNNLKIYIAAFKEQSQGYNDRG